MIAPTLRAIFLMLAGLPVMLFIAVAAPGLWTVSAGWLTGVLALMLIDAALVSRARDLKIDVRAPKLLYISAEDPIEIEFHFARGRLPREVETELETNALIEPPRRKLLRGFADRRHTLSFDLTPIRRGPGRLERLWARWAGPLGLVAIRKIETLDTEIAITPNTRWVKEEAVRIYQRDADFGIKMQIERGDGSEFDALREFVSGMDRRAIDWKHSARHRVLLAKEFRTERNHNIVFAFDTGRLMSEPLRGVPKIDRAINAALLLAYVSLRAGDRTAIFGFDAQPGIASNVLTGTGAFPHIQRLAAELDYSAEDANYTLALTSLASRLERRSLVILFTDFVDTISAELMLENVRRLTDKHIVVFATFEDEALSSMINAEPDTAEDVSRAVIADTLLQEREVVFRKLQRMGVQIVETTPERFGSELVSRYLDIKRRELL
ncbi:DUF58 domain-containing protein [Henriciella litoralis]|uniref:DUF58 domain-containing protein n=1 Tax=Henriciella litoralis TaxID=568102 RepID=UPI0009FDDFF7|nr:DUF58 domain-containing protein [Henriciella litoralis]